MTMQSHTETSKHETCTYYKINKTYYCVHNGKTYSFFKSKPARWGSVTSIYYYYPARYLREHGKEITRLDLALAGIPELEI